MTVSSDTGFQPLVLRAVAVASDDDLSIEDVQQRLDWFVSYMGANYADQLRQRGDRGQPIRSVLREAMNEITKLPVKRLTLASPLEIVVGVSASSTALFLAIQQGLSTFEHYRRTKTFNAQSEAQEIFWN